MAAGRPWRGYGPAYVTKRPTKIAVIPVGYCDGVMVEKARDTFRFQDTLRYCLSDCAKWFRRKRLLCHGQRPPGADARGMWA